MQKILQFPLLSTKESYFSEKINVINETFCQIGKNSETICYLGNDAEIDKKASDILSIYWKFFNQEFVY